MTRRTRFQMREDIERRIAQGRGSGSGQSYSPWLTVRDVPSQGRCHRPHGIKTRRTHHLLSDLEHKVFLCQEFCAAVLDLREQFPLLPYGLTSELASEMGVKHPRYPGTKLDVVLTTDLLLTLSAGPTPDDCVQIAVSVKPSKDLDSPRVLEKLEIERRYWQHLGVQWYLMTERDVPVELYCNLMWVRDGALLDLSSYPAEVWCKFIRGLAVPDFGQRALQEDIEKAAVRAGLRYEDAIPIFKYAVWHQLIRLSLAWRELNLQQPCFEPALHTQVCLDQEALRIYETAASH